VEAQSIVHASVDIVAEVGYRRWVAAPAMFSGGRVMSRVLAAVAVLSLCVVVRASADVEKFGKALTVKEVTKISDIYANPDKYQDKRVKVQGSILDVCTDEGCWIAIASDKPSESLRFKVDDGVIVFPTAVKGKVAVAEGVIAVTKAADGKVSILLKGEGAEIK